MPTSHARDDGGSADGEIVAALVAGDLSALGHAYDRYARHLFTYANGMLHNADTAADVVHDALLIASQRIAQLRDPDRFRPWLYAIVRSECLRHLRRGKRSVPLADDFDLAAEDSPEHTVAERDLQALVAAAAAGLSPKDREVLELSIRHDLDNAQVAAVLGIGMNQASTLTSRARNQLERSLSVLLVAQERGNQCPELDELLASWDGEFTPLWRKRIGRHVDKCTVCSGTKERKFRASALLAVLPLALVPLGLREKTMHDAYADVALVSLSRRIDPLDRSGFPAASARGRKGLVAAAAGTVVLVGVGVAVLLLQPNDAPTPVGVAGVVSSPAASSAPPVAAATTTASTVPVVAPAVVTTASSIAVTTEVPQVPPAPPAPTATTTAEAPTTTHTKNPVTTEPEPSTTTRVQPTRPQPATTTAGPTTPRIPS